MASKVKLPFSLASTSSVEAEVIVNLDKHADTAHVCSCWPDMTRKLFKRFGPPNQTSQNPQGQVTAACWQIPLTFVVSGLLRKGRTGRKATPQQLAALKKAGQARTGRAA